MLDIFLNYNDLSVLLLRIIVALVFVASGLAHLKNPQARAESIGMSKGFAIFLGLAETLGAIALITGFLIQYAAVGLMLVMLGAMYKKAFVWKTGFLSGGGYHYDLMLFLMNFVILTTAGGAYTLF
jgi:putative oxidoreductase